MRTEPDQDQEQYVAGPGTEPSEPVRDQPRTIDRPNVDKPETITELEQPGGPYLRPDGVNHSGPVDRVVNCQRDAEIPTGSAVLVLTETSTCLFAGPGR